MPDTSSGQRRPHFAFRRSTRSKRPFKVGDPLEYRVSRLFVHLGYFVRRARQLYTIGNLDTATDLDVLAIRYADPFRREVQIAECKQGGAGPLDRIFWLSGVKQYVAATRATLVRPATKWNVTNFASEAGLEILDIPHLESLESLWIPNPNLWLAASDREFFLTREDEWNRAAGEDTSTYELCQTLASEVRYHDPFGGINFLIHHLRALTRGLQERRFSSESLIKFLIAESVAQLSMFIMRITETSMVLSQADREGLIRKGMTYGHMDNNLIDRIFRNAKRITHETVKHYTGQDPQLDESFFRMPPSPHTETVQEIVGMLVARPNAATTLAPMSDLLLSERFVKQRESTEWLARVFPMTNLRERLTLVQDYLKALGKIGAVPEGLFGKANSATVLEPSSQGPASVPTTINQHDGRERNERANSSSAPSLFDEKPNDRKGH